MDPSGRFVVVSQSASSTNLPGALNQITVFTFDPGTGAMKKLQSYPQPQAPGAIVMVAR
jgi:6-phosphogluconolactonase (cycloisomerase 2 family)